MKSNMIIKPGLYPLLRRNERHTAWEKARGMWKHRRPNPIKELATMRREWERTKSSK